MARKTDNLLTAQTDRVARIFEQKAAFHRQQARLPIEEKIRILIELQKIALTVRPNQGPDDPRVVWQIPQD